MASCWYLLLSPPIFSFYLVLLKVLLSCPLLKRHINCCPKAVLCLAIVIGEPGEFVNACSLSSDTHPVGRIRDDSECPGIHHLQSGSTSRQGSKAHAGTPTSNLAVVGKCSPFRPCVSAKAQSQTTLGFDVQVTALATCMQPIRNFERRCAACRRLTSLAEIRSREGWTSRSFPMFKPASRQGFAITPACFNAFRNPVLCTSVSGYLLSCGYNQLIQLKMWHLCVKVLMAQNPTLAP